MLDVTYYICVGDSLDLVRGDEERNYPGKVQDNHFRKQTVERTIGQNRWKKITQLWFTRI